MEISLSYDTISKEMCHKELKQISGGKAGMMFRILHRYDITHKDTNRKHLHMLFLISFIGQGKVPFMIYRLHQMLWTYAFYLSFQKTCQE
jgi:hypothetical protein